MSRCPAPFCLMGTTSRSSTSSGCAGRSGWLIRSRPCSRRASARTYSTAKATPLWRRLTTRRSCQRRSHSSTTSLIGTRRRSASEGYSSPAARTSASRSREPVDTAPSAPSSGFWMTQLGAVICGVELGAKIHGVEVFFLFFGRVNRHVRSHAAQKPRRRVPWRRGV